MCLARIALIADMSCDEVDHHLVERDVAVNRHRLSNEGEHVHAETARITAMVCINHAPMTSPAHP